jgi:heme/copper-type cytochrome/quinol oxidase subunit 2
VKLLLKILLLAVALAPSPLFACATCFGQSDSPMAQGMNWGIFTLLGVIVTVLATIFGFFVYLIRKVAAAESSAPETLTEA